MNETQFFESEALFALSHTELRQLGDCCLAICTLENHLRFNVLLDRQGDYKIWTFLASDFQSTQWPALLRLAEELPPQPEIKLEITDELDLRCFTQGRIPWQTTAGALALSRVLEAFIRFLSDPAHRLSP